MPFSPDPQGNWKKQAPEITPNGTRSPDSKPLEPKPFERMNPDPWVTRKDPAGDTKDSGR